MGSFNIKSFGMLTEKLPGSEFQFPACNDTEELIAALLDKYAGLRSLDFRIAVNKELVQSKTTLKGNEEIALLPPFSGG